MKKMSLALGLVLLFSFALSQSQGWNYLDMNVPSSDASIEGIFLTSLQSYDTGLLGLACIDDAYEVILNVSGIPLEDWGSDEADVTYRFEDSEAERTAWIVTPPNAFSAPETEERLGFLRELKATADAGPAGVLEMQVFDGADRSYTYVFEVSGLTEAAEALSCLPQSLF